MALWGIFKKKKVEEGPRIIRFEEISGLIDREIEEIEKNSGVIRKEINKDIVELVEDVKEKIPELKKINLDKKRENPKLKEIVMENLFSWIESVEGFMNEIKDIGADDLREYLKILDSSIVRFSKNSRPAFEKATILIGNEIGEIRTLIGEFTKKLNVQLGLAGELFRKQVLINEIRNFFGELDDMKEIEKKTGIIIEEIENKIIFYEKELKNYEKEAEDYEKSRDYLEFVEEQNLIEQENKKTDSEIARIKQDIDFKELLKHFHGDLKKSNFIKNYSDDFVASLVGDDGLKIVGLVREADLDIDGGKLKELKKKIGEKREVVRDEKVVGFENKIKELNQEIVREKNNLEQEKNKNIRFKEKEQKIVADLKIVAEKLFSSKVE